MRFRLSINNEGNPLGVDPLYFIVHHTGSDAPDENQKKFLNRDEGYISVHFQIYTRGQIFQLMDLDRIAYHCGISEWDGYGINPKQVFDPMTGDGFALRGLNPYAHGVEINSAGEKFTKSQRKACIKLCAWWCIKYDRPVTAILRHKHIAPDRKWDVGPAFFEPYGDWDGFRQAVQKQIDSVRRHFDSIQESREVVYVKSTS